jgi:peptidoglycan/xylan/chitin deacetylase (PgdA/CDA1 family)
LGIIELPPHGQARTPTVMQVNAAVKHLPFDERARVVEAIRRAADVELPRDLMMSSAQLRALDGAGMDIGGHTVRHPILTRCDDATAWREITEGARHLQSVLHRPIHLFAYPNGQPGADYGSAHVGMVREAGFHAAFSTSAGAARRGDDPFQLPRFMPWDMTRVRFALRMLKNLRTPPQTVRATAARPMAA